MSESTTRDLRTRDAIAPRAPKQRRPIFAVGWARQAFGASVSRTVGIVIFGLIVLLCIVVPIVSPYQANDFVGLAFQPPSLAHPFGTDAVGRDLFVRTWEGGRVDLIAAAIVTGFALLVGTTLGTLAGSSRQRWLDSFSCGSWTR
ncbi:hypothetical protein [Naasia aerilata]|uniref:hypothetical protein n=1 Tax=Naasia aerilata TaxID=1162966 RepID=UPI002572CE53|nr:hypothetical protein [Naasia aerilata]